MSISTVPILFKNWVSSSGVANELPVGDGGPVPTVGDIGPVPTVRDGKPAPTVEKRPQTEIERRHR